MSSMLDSILHDVLPFHWNRHQFSVVVVAVEFLIVNYTALRVLFLQLMIGPLDRKSNNNLRRKGSVSTLAR